MKTELDGELAVQALKRWNLDADIRSRYSNAAAFYDALVLEREQEKNPSPIVKDAKRRAEGRQR